MGEGTRYERTDHQHMARVREAREQLDRIDPEWSRRILERQRAARGAVRHG
jgi:hypothetical protein